MKLNITVTMSLFPKCERCWKCKATVGCHPRWSDLCLHCAFIVDALVQEGLWQPKEGDTFAKKNGPVCCSCEGFK